MMSMPLSARLVSSVSRISPRPPPNSTRKITRKWSLTASKASLKAPPRFNVQLLNRLLRIADGIEQILALRVQEVVALLRLLEFFQRLRIHRPQSLNPRPHFLVTLLGFRHTGLVQRRVLAGTQAPATSAAAAFSSLRLVSSRYFRSPCFLTSSSSISARRSCAACGLNAQSPQRFLQSRQRRPAVGRLRRQLLHRGDRRARFLGQHPGALIQLDIVSQQPRRDPRPCAPAREPASSRREAS